MEQYDVVIVGAGISGLSLAYYCARSGIRTLVVEKADRVGGSFHSHRFEGDPGFWMELGAHTCYNSYGNLLKIIETCKIMDRIIRRQKVPFKMLVGGGIKSIPSQLNVPELLLSAPRLFALKKEGNSIESYYSKIVGRGNFERVFGPAFNAVISQRANDFPAEMLFKKRPRRKGVFKSFTLGGGVQTIVEAIPSLPGIEVIKGREVRTAECRDGIFSITTGNGDRFESSALALATPPPVASVILGDSFPALSEKLSRIRVETVETVGAAVRKNALSLPPLAGIIAADDTFYSAVSRDTVPHENYRGFSFHFKPGRVDQEAKLRRIGEVLKVDPGQLEHVVAKENIVPSLKVGHDSLVKEIDGIIAGKCLLLTGNYFSGMAIEDCVSRSLSEFYRLKEVLRENGPGRR